MMRFVFYDTPLDIAANAARLRAGLAAARMRLAMLKLALALKYSPYQPRVPAGSPDGGQWTDAGVGGGYVRVAENDSGPTATDRDVGDASLRACCPSVYAGRKS